MSRNVPDSDSFTLCDGRTAHEIPPGRVTCLRASNAKALRDQLGLLLQQVTLALFEGEVVACRQPNARPSSDSSDYPRR